MPKISVIVPIYKVEQYLNRCVESILAQTYIDFELILVDDGSPDNCPEMCDAWAQKDNRIKVIHKQNGGLSDARNAGLDWMEANSESCYVTFIDSDDCVHPQYLETMLTLLEKNEADMTWCHYDFFTKEDEWFNGEAEIEDLEFYTGQGLLDTFSEHCRKVSLRSQCMKLYKRELFSGLRMRVGYTQEDSMVLPFVLEKAGRIVRTSLKLYHWRVTPGSISQSAFNASNFHYIDIAYTNARFFIKRRHKQAAYFKREFLYNSLKYYVKTQEQKPDLMTELKPYIRLYRKHWIWIFTKNLCFRERVAYGLYLVWPKKAQKLYMQVHGERYEEEYW